MKIGTLMIEMAANVARLEKDMRRAVNSVDGAMNKIRRAASLAVKALGALGAGIGIAQFAQMIRQTSAMADEIDRFARLANTTTAEFQKISIAAQRFGVSQEKVADILKDVQDKVGDFLQTGAGPMVDFFEQIAPKVGVTAEQFRKLSGREALQLYVSSIEKANLSQSDMVFYMEAIASDSTLLLPLLKNNGKAYAEIASEAERLGQVLSDETIQANRELAQELLKLDAVFQGLKNQALAPIIETLRNMAAALTEMIANGAIQKGIENLVMVFKALAVVLVSRVVGALAATAAGMIKTATAMTALELALVAGAVKMKAFAVAANLAKGALAFIGGPVGVAITAAAAIYQFAIKNDDATQSVEGFRKAQGLSNQTIKEFDLFDANTQLNEYQIELAKAQVEVIKLTKAQQELNASSADPEAYHFLGGQNSTAMKEATIRAKALEESIADLQAHIESLEAAEESSSSTREDFNNSLSQSGKSVDDLEDKYRDMIRAYVDEADMLLMTREEREIFIFQNKMIGDGIAANTKLFKEMTKVKRDAIRYAMSREAEVAALEREAEALEKFKQKAQTINEQIGQSLTDALMNGTKSAGEFMKDFFKTLVLRPILQPLITGVTGALGIGAAGASMAGGLPGVGMGDVAGGGTDIFGVLQTAQNAYSAISSGFASVGAAASSTAKTLLGFEAAVASSAASPAANASVMAIEASAAQIGAAATAIAGIAAGVAAGSMISGQYSVAGDKMVSVAVGTAAGAIIGSVVPVIGTAIGAFVGGAIGGAVNRAFGHGPKDIKAAGITGSIGFEGANISNFADWKQKGGWFRSDKTGTDITAADPMLVGYLDQQLNTIGGSIGILAQSIGYSAADIGDYTESIRLDLKGLTEEEAQQAITDRLKQFSNGLTNFVAPAIQYLSKEGESSSETLTRLATALTTVNTSFDSLGVSLLDVSLNSAKAASDLIDMVGGVDEFTNKSNFIFENFYTEQERIEVVTQKATDALAQLGLEMPTTREAFKSLFQVVAGSGSSSMTAALMNLAPVINEVIGYTEKQADANRQLIASMQAEMIQLDNQVATALGDSATLRERELESMHEANRALAAALMDYEAAQTELANASKVTDAAFAQLETALRDRLSKTLENLQRQFDETTSSINDQITAQQTALQVANENLTSLTSMFNLIRREIDSIMGGSAMSAAEGRAFIANAVANAQNTGYLPEQDALSQAIRAARTGLGSENFSSAVEQRIATATLAAQLQSLADITETQMTDAEKAISIAEEQLQTLKQQLEQANAQYEADRAAAQANFDQQLQQAQNQINALRDIDDSVFSVDQAVQRLNTAISSEQKATSHFQQELLDLQKERNAREKAEADRLAKEKADAEAAADKKAAEEEKAREIARAQKELQDYVNSEAAIKGQIAATVPTSLRPGSTNDALWEALVRDSYDAHVDAFGFDWFTSRTSDADRQRQLEFLQGEYKKWKWEQEKVSFNAEVERLRQQVRNLGGVPAYAKGGYMSPGLSLVGEEGPELVNFKRPSMVYTANETAQILNGGNVDQKVASEINYLREENKAQTQALVSMQYRLTRLLERWDVDGLPEERMMA